ncbi:BCCT family transporter [Dorea sp. D27]|uniref:BCCT family transporter n=1 Tax=Dorea sp. D27 TaxID=658665 RepID=UPI000673AA65|nr:BCCT family transporter [Dorea sp. D27]
MSNGNDKTVHISLRKRVFFPPWILLIVLVGISLLSEKSFLSGMQAATGFILDNFAWAFNLTTLGCLAVVIIVFVSPLGKVRIGGSKARPIMKFRNLAWITLCTTVASGVLFWACAEPLYHMYTPAAAEGVEAGSPGAAVFAMKTMFLEWTWSPYAIYTVATLLFAFVFYNMRKSYSIGSAFVPVFGDKAKRYNGIIDVICLFALVLGMAASLGTGTLTMGGGIENVFGIKSGPVSWGFIILAIVATFIISSVSGVMKGIKLLSSLNGQVYIFLLLFVLIFGPTAFMMNFSVESLGAYVQDFFRMSLMTGDIHGDPWARSWPIFYWCVWMAWAPISGVFLGKILKGYTIRDAIVCNFVIPSVFSMVWMGLFSTASIYFENHGVGLYDSLLKNGTESVVYKVFEQLPLAAVVIPFYLFIVFISFVTAADSNTNAMSGLCVKGLTVDNQESPSWLKICWGLTLGVLTWVLISFAGIDGIKAASNLGGFPIMFIIIIFIVGLLKVCRNPKKYDMFQEDYDSEGRPIESVRLPIETEE